MAFAQNFKLIRERNHLSQADIARELKLNRQTVNNWEKRGTKPDDKTLLKLSELFNCSITFLLYGEELSELNDAANIKLKKNKIINSLDMLTEAELDHLPMVLDFLNFKKAYFEK